MIVANVIGYDFSFKYKGKDGEGIIKIPFDGIPYSVPDDIFKFKELKEVMVVDTSNKKIVLGNFEKEKKPKDNKKPLAGIKIKKKKKNQILSKKVK